MSWLDSLERRFGRWAVPHLLRFIAIVQLVVFVVALSQPDYLEALRLQPELILRGEVWRVLSFVFIPRTTSLIWILFAVMLLFYMNSVLEAAWGAFRLNIYYFSCVALLNVATFFFLPGGTGLESELLYQSLFLALCAVAPEEEILLLVFPVKLKYLGIFTMLWLLWTWVNVPALTPQMLAVLIPFAAFLGPDWWRQVRHRQQVNVRRVKFQSQLRDAGEAFHHCAECGLTELKDPQADFRVLPDGRELCHHCLARAGKGTSGNRPPGAQ